MNGLDNSAKIAFSATNQPAPPRGGSFVCQILAPDAQGLAEAARLLNRGQLVAIPTETVYGLAANAFDQQAVRQIFVVKNRPWIDPLIVHVANAAEATRLAVWNDLAQRLTEVFWPGPLTIVLPHRGNLPAEVTAHGPSVALRCPSHEVAQAVLQRTGFPLAAPSANPFGYLSPTTAEHVLAGLGGRIAAVLDGGPCACGVESAIVDLRDPARPGLLRPGPLTPETIRQQTGVWVDADQAPAHAPNPSGAQVAPGNLSRHYSPHTPIQLVCAGEISPLLQTADSHTAFLFLQRPPEGIVSLHPSIFWLSANGNWQEAEHQLYALLRHIDSSRFQKIVVESPPPEGPARALHDRLQRAAAKAS